MSVLSYDGSDAERQGAQSEIDRQIVTVRQTERKKINRKKRREGPNKEKCSTAHQSLG